MNVSSIASSSQLLQKTSVEAQSVQTTATAATKPALNATDEAVLSTGAETKALTASVNAINAFLKTFSNNIEFSIDNGTGRTVVKLVDTETNTVLRQYPTKEALALAKDIENFQGQLLKTEV